MSNLSYSKICDHTRLSRLDNHFVRCLDCGQSMISHRKMLMNKTRKDFTKENKTFEKNFDRNFTNIIEEIDHHEPIPYDYYTDKNWVNNIIIDRTVQYLSYPPQYKITINGKQTLMDNQQINKLLDDIHAIRIDEQQFMMRFGKPELHKN